MNDPTVFRRDCFKPNCATTLFNQRDSAVRRQYEQALTNGARIAGPAAEALLHFLKTELELGHCLRLPAEGPCECDLVLNCPKFLTTSEYAPRLRARLETEKVLIQDARQRGWEREIERHQTTSRRLEQLLSEWHRTAAAIPVMMACREPPARV